MVGDDKSIDIFVYIQLVIVLFLRGKGKVGRYTFLLFKLKSIVFRGTRKRKLGRYISELGNLSLLGTVTS